MENLNQSQNLQNRLGKCEVCDCKPAKYTCPQCEVKTCSLQCVNIHKKELQCIGQRNRVKFIRLDKFTSMDLQSDYTLLEEAGRTASRVSSELKLFSESKCNLLKVEKLRKAARIRGIKLEFLPQKFSKHKENTTYLNWKTGELYWKIKWVFPEAMNFAASDSRILDSQTLIAASSKYISNDIYEQNIADKLKVYHNIAQNEIQILLKAEKTGKNTFYETQLDDTISHNLRGKIIVEHPVFYVILIKNIKDYEILKEVPKAVSEDKHFRKMSGNQNFLFSSVEDYKYLNFDK